MPTWLIDDQGDLSDAASPRLRRALGGFSLGSDFNDYVIRNLGFVLVAPQPNGAVRIRFRPRIAAPLALAGLIYWLADRKPPRVMLSHLDREWTHELLGSFALARQKIIGLTAHAQASTQREFLSKPLNVQDVGADNPLMALVRLHDEARGMALDTMTDFSLEVLKGRYLVSEMQPGSQRVVLTAVGPGLDPQARFWLERFVGMRLEDAADISYGQWIAEATRDVLAKGRPRLDAVDVSISWPGGDQRRYQFQRALIPMALGSTALGAERRGVLSATIVDKSIDLRGARVVPS